MIVLIVAGVFVAAGLVLIILSFLVGRSRRSAETPEAEADAALSAGTSEGTEVSTFIDEPLATDIGEMLKGRKKEQAPPPAETDAGAAEGAATGAPPDDAMPSEAPAGEPAETPAPGPAPDGDEPREPAPAPAASQVGYNFRVQLGFKFLQNGLYQDGVLEFQKALSLTDDPEAKLKLYIEIGNALRSQKMFGPASAAYLQATSYTENEMLLEHLERTIAEMMDTDKVGAADSASGSEKEE